MTKKEAIYILRNAAWLGSDADRQKVEEAVEVVARAIEALNHSEIPNTSEPKCADGCIYGWGSSECGHCDYRSEESKTGDYISRKAAIDVAIKADIENNGGVLSEKRARIIDKRISAMPSAQPEPIRINLNEPIKVKLTDWGKEIYYHQHDRTNQIAGKEICKPKFPKEDENGYTEFQLWCFMELYGECMGMTLPNVIKPLEIVYER